MKRLACYALAALALAGGGYSFGRYAAPDKVKTVDRVVYQDREVVKTVKEAAEVKHVIVYREKTTKPDGTITERESERADTVTTETAKVDASREHSGESTKEKAVERLRPDWRLGAMAGVDLRTGAFGYGGTVERRILGPISLGAWGLSSGQVGVSLSVEF